MSECAPYDLVKQHYTLPFNLREFAELRVNKQALLARTGLYWDVGTGKTGASTVIALYKKLTKGSATFVLMPPILQKSWWRWIMSIKGVGATPGPTATIYRGTPEERRKLPLDRDFTLMTIQVFKRDFEYLTKMFEHRPVTLVVDECFPAGTLVRTSAGTVGIETLQVGDQVITSRGVKPVVGVYRKTTRTLLTLRLSHGSNLCCTSEHPIFTDAGWLAAKNCQGRKVLVSSAVPDLRGGIQKADVFAQLGGETPGTGGVDLFALLWAEAAASDQAGCLRGRCGCPDGVRPLYAGGSPNAAENERTSGEVISSVEGALSDCSRRERIWADTSRRGSGAATLAPGVPMEFGGFAGEEGARVPNQLQAGLRSSEFESGAGSGREISFSRGSNQTRPKEGAQAPGTWVEDISYQEYPSPVSVWNLEVGGCPHYFAGDVLVHNCTSIKNVASQNYKRVRDFVDGV